MEIYGTLHDGNELQTFSYNQYIELMSGPLPFGWQIISIPSEWKKKYEKAKAAHGMDSRYKELSDLDWRYYREAVQAVLQEAASNSHKRLKMATLLEEFSEAVLACRGKHDDPLELELTQIASVAINLLWQLKMGYDINNFVTNKEDTK